MAFLMRIRLILEYDGTAYAGWQIQPNGLSVQAVVETALAQLTGEFARLHSSGRTDAGVHARGMVAHFTSGRELPLSAFREGLNRLLPADIAVRVATRVADDFHARFDATGKWYRYTLQTGAVRSPLQARTAWHVRGRLDLEAMRRAAAAFVGRHDFSAFRGAGCESQTSEREIFALEIAEAGELIHLDVKGEGFLRNMVRAMVGTLVEIGLGRRPVEDVAARLVDGRRVLCGRTAPPQGLCLMEVWYADSRAP
jgi:tRNA pseudouridine38-40 synthase